MLIKPKQSNKCSIIIFDVKDLKLPAVYSIYQYCFFNMHSSQQSKNKHKCTKLPTYILLMLQTDFKPYGPDTQMSLVIICVGRKQPCLPCLIACSSFPINQQQALQLIPGYRNFKLAVSQWLVCLGKLATILQSSTYHKGTSMCSNQNSALV